MGRQRANPEDPIHKTVLAYIRFVMPAALAFHVPNGGFRLASEAAKLKEMGVEAGIFDLQLYLPGGRIACIEVKAPGGALSDAQKAVAACLDERSIPWAVVRSIAETRVFLRSLDVPMREANVGGSA